MNHFHPDIDSLLAVVAAEVDSSGTLLAWNAGFLRLLTKTPKDNTKHSLAGSNVSAFFIQPRFAALAAGGGGEEDGRLLHEGMMTVGDRDGRLRTRRGRVWRAGGGLRILAEQDIRELERVHESLLSVSRNAVDSQHAIGRANLRLRLRQREASIVESALTDPLTGPGNRRLMDRELGVDVSRARRTGNPRSVFMADLDHFKRVNDDHGHAAGDAALGRFAELMRAQLRATDVLMRYGG